MDSNRLVVRFCYLGMFVQALVINLAPVLFIPLKTELGLTYEQLGRLILINFSIQIVMDLGCGALVPKVGPKRFIVAANALACLGLVLFAVLPALLEHPYTGLVIGTLVFAAGAGLLELMLSPIMNAVPSEQKAQDMALAHSFYAWGQLCVILFTTLALFAFGVSHWRLLTLCWAIFPLLATIGFARLTLPPFVPEAQRQRMRSLIRQPAYLVAVACIGLAGASEVSVNQWISAYAERGLGFPKLWGDLGGMCLFAAAIGVGRVWFGIKGEKLNLHRVLLVCACLSVVVYLIASLAPWPFISLAACVIAGLGVSLLWPGMLSVTAARFPLAGASMFAVMAASGDLGAAVAPWFVGYLADLGSPFQALFHTLLGPQATAEQIGLRTGLLVATAYPLLLIGLLYWLKNEATRTHKAATEGARELV